MCVGLVMGGFVSRATMRERVLRFYANAIACARRLSLPQPDRRPATEPPCGPDGPAGGPSWRHGRLGCPRSIENDRRASLDLERPLGGEAGPSLRWVAAVAARILTLEVSRGQVR